MKTPVIIPAYNEELHIARVLDSMPRDLVEPIVSVNGTTDRTIDIAKTYGVTIIDSEQQGKQRAIQSAIRSLVDSGDERVFGPMLVLDGDSHPRSPQRWHDRMVRELEPNGNRPVVVSGRAWFTPRTDDMISPVIRSLFRVGEAIYGANDYARRTGLRGGQYGPNQGVNIYNDERLDAVLELANFWPQQDRAFTHAIVGEEDEDGVFKQLLHPETIVFTPESISYPSILRSIKIGARRTREEVLRSYTDRAAPGTEPFHE